MRNASCILVLIASLMAGCTFSPNPFQPDQVFVYNSTSAPVNATVSLVQQDIEVFNETFTVMPNSGESRDLSRTRGDYIVRVLLDDGRTTVANVTLSAGSQTVAVDVDEKDLSVSMLHGD